MRLPLTLSLGVFLVLANGVPLLSQTKAPDLRLPPYDDKYVLEITAPRLDDLETKLKALPDRAVEEKKSNEASAASQQWRDCRSKEEAGLRAQAKPQYDKDKAQINANSDEMKRLGEEMREKLKTAKSPEEMQKIAMEYQEKQQALMPQSAQSSPENVERHAKAERQAEQQIVSKCGTEPPNVVTETKRLEGEPGIYLMVERVGGFCGVGFATDYVGPDGSLSSWEAPFNSRDKGNSQAYNVKVYSPSEAKLLRQRCPRLQPLLESRGFNY